MSVHTGYTQSFYAYEERGRGWRVYDLPVELEPPCEPPTFLYKPSEELPSGFDDGKNQTLLGRLFKGFTTSKEPQPVEPEPPTISYPDAPALFECTSSLRTFGVTLPKEYDVSATDALHMLSMLSSTKYPIAYEVLGTAESIFVQWTCRDVDATKLVAQLQSYFPGIQISEHPPLDITLNDHVPITAIDLGLGEEFMRPLNTATAFSPDPLVGILANFEFLQPGEMGMLQILFKGSVGAWGAVIQEISTDGNGKSIFDNAPEFPKLAQEKTSSPLYGVVIRVVGQGATKERSSKIAEDLADAVCRASASPYNTLIPLSNKYYSYDDHIEAVLDRTSYRLGMLLNCAELVGFVHLPAASVTTAKFQRNIEHTKAASKDLQGGKYAIGVNDHNGQTVEVCLTDEHRLRHMHVIGATGVGKSTFLINLFLQDVEQGNGAALFDPHGDTVDDILKRIPKHRLNDVILIDPSDTEYPIGFNLFQANSDIEKIVLSSDLIESIRERATSWGDSINSILANAIQAFLESKRGGTLVELRKFLVDPAYRAEYLKGVDDSSIRAYWQQDFPKVRKDAVSPILTRLDTFLRPKIVRYAMAQAKGIDFNEVLRTNKIVLIKLSQGLIGEENSYLLGTLFLSKFYQAAQARQLLPKEERSPYYLTIDEFHSMISPSLNPILSGARKYALGLVLAHQELSQIEDSTIANSIISNPGIRVCFRLGDNDARKLEGGFEAFEAKDLQSLGIGEAIVRVAGRDRDFNMLTSPLSNAIDTGNFTYIQANTRKLYATPKAEVEAYLDTLLTIPVVVQDKVERKEVPKEPIVPKPVPVEVIEVKPKVETIVPLPTLDISKAGAEFTEATKKRREEREHTYVQDFVKKIGEQRGFKAIIEAPVGDGRIDVVLNKDDVKVACEISVTNSIEYEVRNLKKCIEGGYSQIVMLCNNETHLTNIQALAKKELSKHIHQIHFTKPEHFHLYLDKNTPVAEIEEHRVNGYRIRTVYNPTQNNEEKRKIIKDAILKSMLKK